MPRCNGSYIGIDANPNANVASGIWTVREAETYLRANKWPATPTVPGAPSGFAGNGQVFLTWTAPTGGATPTDYEVQYSSNGGSTWTTFSDGVSTATSATVTGLTNDTGYIFRVRAVNALGEGPYGSASGTVTPASGILLGASLLLHFDGANGSTTFTDSSPNNLTVTANGNAQISTAQSKWGGSSGYFDADAGTYASISSFPDFDGAGDFTIEMWIYANIVGPWQPLLGSLASANGGLWFSLNSAQDTDTLAIAQHNFALWEAGPAGIQAETWHHIACVRIGNVLRFYVDGSQIGSDIDVTGLSFPIGDLYIGSHNIGATEVAFNGYIDDLRIVKGVAVYTGNFTPPTSPLAAYVTVAPALLLHFDGSNGSTTFTDSSPNARTVTAYGDAQISTAQSKFGGASAYFDGWEGGDYIQVAASSDLQPLGKDFTIEFWYYPQGGERIGFMSAETDFWLGLDYWNGALGMWASSDGTAWDILESDTSQGRGSIALTDDEWHHIAFTRSGDDWRIFVDGVMDKKVTASGSVVDKSSEKMTIGYWAGGGPFFGTQGYIDEFRYVVGIAVYDSDNGFTPPTSPF